MANQSLVHVIAIASDVLVSQGAAANREAGTSELLRESERQQDILAGNQEFGSLTPKTGAELAQLLLDAVDLLEAAAGADGKKQRDAALSAGAYALLLLNRGL